MKVRQIIRNNVRMLSAVFRFTPLYAWLSLVVMVLIAADNVLCGSLLINYLYNALADRSPIGEIFLVLGLAGLLLTVRYLLRACLEEAVKPKAKVTLYERMQLQIFEKAVQMDLDRYDDPSFYNDFVFAASQADNRVLETFETLVRILSCLLMFGGYIGLMISLDPMVLVPAGIFFFTTYLLNLKRVKLSFSRAEALKPEERRRDYTARIFYLPDYAKELRLTEIGTVITRIFHEAMEAICGIVDRFGRKLAGVAVGESVAQALLLNGGLYAYLAYALLVSHTIRVGGLMALAVSAENVIWRVNDIVALLPKFAENALYAEIFEDFLRSRPQIKSGSKIPAERGTLELRNVSFGYGEKRVLHSVNLTLFPGEKVAVVGSNGAGKSTLVKLLLRLYDVTEGVILYDGQNIQEYDVDVYRRRFGCCFQDFRLYAASLAENVAMSTAIDEPHAMTALCQSGFGKRLGSLPAGLQTSLTKEFEEAGVNLSGGEAQKIAIARVLYQDAAILILDEPSAALDPVAEYELNRIIAHITEGKTVLFISHRLAAASMADRICVLEEGRIVEEGSHIALLEKNGVYAEMWRAQGAR